MKAIIIDDEAHCIETLTWLVQKYCKQIQLIGSYESAMDAIEPINSLTPDIIFLDIEMPQLNGFGLLNKIEIKNTSVIFTTAYNHFAVQAFKVSATDYLLKPVDREDLVQAIKKVEQKKYGLLPEQFEILVQYIKNGNTKPVRVALTTPDHLIFADAEDIIYCESDSNYTLINLVSGEKVLISKTLKDIEAILQGGSFFRIHASYLINLKHIKKFTRGDGGYVVMSNNQHITVSRSKKEEFFKLFSKI